MSKVPVFATIGRAYGFTFGSLGTIIGLIWLPTSILLVSQYYVSARYLSSYLSAFANGNLYELNSALALRYLAAGSALLLQAIVVTPVMRQALGLRTGRAFVSFAIGPTALRVFGAMIALALVLLALKYLALVPLVLIIAAAAVALSAAGTVYGLSSTTWVVLAAAGAFALFIGALVFIAVRLSFFVVAVAVAERKIDLIRAWRLTEWNFWRILAVVVSTTLPLALVYVALMWAALGFPLLHAFSPALLASWKGAPTEAMKWFINAASERLPYIFGVWVVLAPFSAGLSTGAAAAAYLALVKPPEIGGPADAPVPEPAAA